MHSEAESLDCAEAAFAASGELVQDATHNAPPALCMDEADFRSFYDSTAPQLRSYLRRVSGDASIADDVLQEAYLRLLCAPLAQADEPHRRHYLFRIATNLLHDHFRASKHSFTALPEMASPGRASREFELAHDLEPFLSQLHPRQREMLWLAYVEGYRHEEIAETLRCKSSSVRPMLFRARQRLAELLRAAGWKQNSAGETSL